MGSAAGVEPVIHGLSRAADLYFKKEFLRLFSLHCTPLLTLGNSVIQLSQRMAQNCAVLQPKILRP